MDCVVAARRDYGLIVEVEGRYRGFVDLDHISHVPMTEDGWPRVGSEQRCLVLGQTNDGRLRLDLRRDDLDLAERAVDLAEVMERWAEVRQSVSGDTRTRQSFFESPDAALLLRWLVTGRGRGTPMAFVWDLVASAPETIREDVASALTAAALQGDRQASSTIQEAYQACDMDLSREVLARLLAEQPPTAEHLAIFTEAVPEQPVLDLITAWALRSSEPEIQNLGARLSTPSSREESQ